jgi:hypothetical protein
MSNTGAVTLFKLGVSGAGHTGLAQNASGATSVPRPVLSMYGRKSYLGQVGVIHRLTNQITASGGAIFQFSGTPNTTVVWAIVTGSGDISPLKNLTDAWGRAYAVYSPGGYSGTLKVQVSYG